MARPQETQELKDRRILTVGSAGLAGWLHRSYVIGAYSRPDLVVAGLVRKPIRRGLTVTEGHGNDEQAEALAFYRAGARMVKPAQASDRGDLSDLGHQLLKLIASNLVTLTPLVAERASMSMLRAYAGALAESSGADIPDKGHQALKALIESMRLMGTGPDEERDRQIIVVSTQALAQWLYARYVDGSSTNVLPELLGGLTSEPILNGAAFARGNADGDQEFSLDRLVAAASFVGAELRPRGVKGRTEQRRQLLSMVIEDVNRLTPVVARNASMPVLRRYAHVLLASIDVAKSPGSERGLDALVEVLRIVVEGDDTPATTTPVAA